MKYTIWSEYEEGMYWGRAKCLFRNCEYSYSASQPHGNPTDAEKAAKILILAHYKTHADPQEEKEEV